MDINNYNISKNKCNKKNNTYSINESKGILIGLILYITKYFSKLIKLKIKINSMRYQRDLEYLFPKLNFVNIKSNFDICIKTNLLGDLNITNLELINKIKTNKIYLLPYYDNENPLIMYRINGSSSDVKQDLLKIKTKINKIDNCYDNLDMENSIYKLYLKLETPFNNNILDLIDYINQTSSNIIYKDKIIHKTKKIEIPTPYLVQIPIPINSYETNLAKQDIIINEKVIISNKKLDELNKIINIRKSELQKLDTNINCKEEIKKLENIIDDLTNIINAINSNLDFNGGGSVSNKFNKITKLYNKIFLIKKVYQNTIHKRL